MHWSDQVVLITGSTGSFGRKIVRILLDEYRPRKVIVFSRDEHKQGDMLESGFRDPSLRYFRPRRGDRGFGDVADR